MPLLRTSLACRSVPLLFATPIGFAMRSIEKPRLSCKPSPRRPFVGSRAEVPHMFLRDAYYNADLRETYHLSAAAAHYEVPLDGIVARELKTIAGRGTLPPWPGV